MAKLIISNLILGYEGKAVSCELNFKVKEGDYVFVMGENGSGKTTFMKTVLGLVPPLKGKVSGDIFPVGYLPQYLSLKQDFPASVKEIVLSGTLTGNLKPFYTKKDKERALYNMQRLKIEDLSSRCFRELSGGQKQKVLLARALCLSDDMLFLDEPITGLDPEASQELYDILYKLNKEGTTIIMISHDMKAAEIYATHILNIGKNGCSFDKMKGGITE